LSGSLKCLTLAVIDGERGNVVEVYDGCHDGIDLKGERWVVW